MLLVVLAPCAAWAQSWPGIDSQSGDEIAARIESRTGRVSVLKDGASWAVDTGEAVRAHQVIVTGDDGHATFRLNDGSTFEVFPNSQVTFRANPGSWRDLLDVWLGKIRVHIQRPNGQPNPNRVFTPTAIISVRGTTFDVTVDDEAEATVVLVEEGSVAVSHRLLARDDNPRVLGAGQQLTVYRNLPLDEARHFDFNRALRAASNIAVQILVRTPRLGGVSGGGGGGGTSPGGGGLPGDSGAHPPPTPPKK
jgi:ferric-dicitrate binding protein FerR (iron transport regulator)